MVPTDALLSRKQLERLIPDTPYHTIRNWERCGFFPKRIRIRGRVYWSENEIQRWIDEHKRRRRGVA